MTILLCYENSTDFCHRHLVAFWLELFLKIKTYEVRVDAKNETIIKLDRPKYLKQKLENIIKESYPMNNFNTIHEAYLYNKNHGYYDNIQSLKLTNRLLY